MYLTADYSKPIVEVIDLELEQVIAASSEINNGFTFNDPFTYNGDETQL